MGTGVGVGGGVQVGVDVGGFGVGVGGISVGVEVGIGVEVGGLGVAVGVGGTSVAGLQLTPQTISPNRQANSGFLISMPPYTNQVSSTSRIGAYL